MYHLHRCHILFDYYPKLWRSLDLMILQNEARRNGDKAMRCSRLSESTTCVQNLARLADQPDLTDMRFALWFTQPQFFMPIMFAENPKFEKYTLSQPNCFEMVSNQYKPLLLGLSFSLHMSTFIYYIYISYFGTEFHRKCGKLQSECANFCIVFWKIVVANQDGPSKFHLWCYTEPSLISNMCKSKWNCDNDLAVINRRSPDRKTTDLIRFGNKS